MRVEELTGVSLFEGLRPEQLATLAPLFRRVSLPAGYTVFAEGDVASELYVLESGEVAIRLTPYDGGSLHIATIRPGGALGWSAALGQLRYTASAVCRTEAQVLAIRGSDLLRVMHTDPELGSLLFERMAQIVVSRFDGLRAQLMRLFQTAAQAGR
jgi:SulP family sulfate permease